VSDVGDGKMQLQLRNAHAEAMLMYQLWRGLKGSEEVDKLIVGQ
jgi:hypothetical protein